MCELFGLSSNVEVGVRISFTEFFYHSRRNPDGWGVGFYKDGDVVLLKEPNPAYDSDLADFLRRSGYVRSNIIISHIRKRSEGEISYRNTHPFSRELLGVRWLFAHNGTVTPIKESPQFELKYYFPVGTTDSEHAFCYIMDQLRLLGKDVKNDFDKVKDTIEQTLLRISRHGKFNILLSDGKYLFAFSNRQRTLFYLIRTPPHIGKIRLRDKKQIFDLSK